MFNGIIEMMGVVHSFDSHAKGKRLVVLIDQIDEEISIGASIAINGCCLTAVGIDKGYYAFDVVQETLSCTCLGDLKLGDFVNIERPMRLGGRLDGHLVQGHVDGMATIISKEEMKDGSFSVNFLIPRNLDHYIVKKGSVAVDGISLTVASVDDKGFGVALIPHTAKVTTLGYKDLGDYVNIEVDILAKYVERLMSKNE